MRKITYKLSDLNKIHTDLPEGSGADAVGM